MDYMNVGNLIILVSALVSSYFTVVWVKNGERLELAFIQAISLYFIVYILLETLIRFWQFYLLFELCICFLLIAVVLRKNSEKSERKYV